MNTGKAVTNDGQGDGETCAAVQEMPMAGPARVRQILAALGISAMQGLPEAGAYHRCMPYGSGQEAMMGIKKWIPLVLITAVVLTVTRLKCLKN